MKNIFGEPLKLCCKNPITGFYRDGFCRTDNSDFGKHTVCVVIDDKFLAFSKARGNDLITPRKEFLFPGLKSGDKWCVCVLRWKEAFDFGCAPKVDLESTSECVLKHVSIKDLINYAAK